MAPAKIFLAPALARRSRLAALAARGAAEDFTNFQVSFPVGMARCAVPAGASQFFGQRKLATLPAEDGKARAGGRRGAPSLPKMPGTPFPTRSSQAAAGAKTAVAFPKAVIPFPKPAATFRPATVPWRKATVHLPKVAAHGRKVAAPFGKVTVHGRKVAVTFPPETTAFPPFSAKTPHFWQNPRLLPVLGRFPAGPPAGSHFPTFRKFTVP